MAKVISTSIIIEAAPEKVWAVLTNFQTYSTWNSFITSIEGNFQVGGKMIVFLQPLDAKGMTFKPTIQQIEANKSFSWLGKLLIPGLFDGEHTFELIANENGTTTFIQSEKFTGILIPLFKKLIDVNTQMAFEQMNHQLKQHVEAGLLG